ncbi:Selenide, water dikinase [Trichlorobacter ammonificans]|uniref:Selenide, water dikinase n=1 Tax=Trichlorobacter ammonificans TaxID=2916410 RepID=A0ABM9DB80_9BACT|nr:Selenide, water dikinase [Trichlorobacter ammonificans]
MSGLRRSDDPRLLVGPETSDDGGVYCLTPDLALVESCDVITPPADDPRAFGKIAAANALSDIYAMGGRPVTAMNLVFFPACSLPPEVLAEILAGGQEMLDEAGCCLTGGHTVEDDELKFGLSVTGTVHPAAVLRNSTARPGDLLVLTKPLGSGIIATAVKGELATPEQEAEAVAWMSLLNRRAAELMLRHRPSACTDITGFGLIGHCCEMAKGAGVTIRLDHAAIPLMGGLSGLIADGMVPAGCYRNRDCYLPDIDSTSLVPDLLLPLFDPQTSGGLLISCAPDDAAAFLADAAAAGVFARPVGAVLPGRAQPVLVA